VKLAEIQQQWDAARLDWEEKERELEVFIRTRDRTILSLRNELEFLNDNWEIKYMRLVGLYEKLQKKYEETIGPNGAQESYKRAQALKAENETLHTMIHELRETIQKQKKVIRGLQLDIDQLMKETADLIAEKERGIAEMAGDFVKLENKYRDEQTLRGRLLKQKDAERLALAESFQARVEQLEQIMEAMRFNDRQELLDKIKLWKKNYERVCNERDELEDHYKNIVERKESQLQNMLIENDEERQKRKEVIEKHEENIQAVHTTYKMKIVGIQAAHEEAQQESRELKVELDKAKFQHERAVLLNERPKEDPQIAPLKERIKEMEEQILMVEAGKQALIDENSSLRVETVNVDSQMEDVHAIYKPQLEKKDREMKMMEQRHEELKEILKLEMKRAQETCKDIEEQVKRFPDPFIDEIQEMKDKYAQMQSGMQKIQVENLHLREQNEKTRKELEKEIKDLEKSLGLAKTLLQEVSTLEALKHLHTSEARRAEEELGLKL
jgi:chromosome segregation ATPase